MASSSKRHGSVKTVEWWKHLRHRKGAQEKRVRDDGKAQIAAALEEEYDDPHEAYEAWMEEQLRRHDIDPNDWDLLVELGLLWKPETETSK